MDLSPNDIRLVLWYAEIGMSEATGENAELRTIMNRLARRYSVTVIVDECKDDDGTAATYYRYVA